MDWCLQSDRLKIYTIKEILNDWKDNNITYTVDDKWFLEELNIFYSTYKKIGMDIDVEKAMMFVISTHRDNPHEHKEKILELINKLTKIDIDIWKYTEKRWKYYDTVYGEYSGDKYDEKVFNDCSKQFDLPKEIAKKTYNKVINAKMGLDI